MSTPTPTPLAPHEPVQWSDPQRQHAFQHWIAGLATAHALDLGSVRLASADASFRRYLRVTTTTHQGDCIIMDAPPDKEACGPFVAVAALMQQAGLKSPAVLDWNQTHGFMLLTDLGQATLMTALNSEKPEAALPWFLQAVDLLIQWQLASRPGVLPPYDDALLERELGLFPHWYVGEHRRVTLNEGDTQVVRRAFDLIKSRNLAAPSVFVHRDFMARNLMLAHPGAADQRLGVLDFQDAVYGPVTYDIASLMRDAFISWEEELILDVTIRYWERARKAGLIDHDGWSQDFGAFYRAVEWMGLQRHFKVAGIFARLTLRDSKPRYLADAPRFIHYIRTTTSRYRELGPLLKVIDHIEGDNAPMGYVFGRL
jgi:N-acetylmuramate 1-kinase